MGSKELTIVLGEGQRFLKGCYGFLGNRVMVTLAGVVWGVFLCLPWKSSQGPAFLFTQATKEEEGLTGHREWDADCQGFQVAPLTIHP